MVGVVYLYSTSVKIWEIELEIAEKTKETRVKQASLLNTHTHNLCSDSMDIYGRV